MITRTCHQNQEKKKKKSKVKHTNQWKHSDLLVIYDFEWNLRIPALDSHEPPSSLFGKFLQTIYYDFVCNESVKCAQSKGNHSSSRDLLIYPDVQYFANVQLVFKMMLFLQ